MVALRRVLREARATAPGLRQAQFVVLHVPAAPWVDLTARAWRRLMAFDFEPTVVEDRHAARGQWGSAERPRWILFAREGGRDDKPDIGNAVVSRAAMHRVPVLGVCADPETQLPSALMQTADVRLVLPRPDVAALRQTARIMTGHSPRMTAWPSIGPVLLPEHLRLACRPNQSADGWMERLAGIVQSVAAPPSGIALADLAGMPAVVEWGNALAQDIDGYRAGRIAWTSVDRGALLAGPPEVGKTTAAAAIAAACGVPLVVTGYAAWQGYREGHIGNVVQALRDAFERARALAPSVLFIDELDSVRKRNGGTDHDDWWVVITNALLEQLDGLSRRDGVVVLGATNHPDKIDPAILRAGRLDRVLWVPLPDAQALRQILRVHLGENLPGADLGVVAERLEARGGTGADAELVVRDARRRARQARRPMASDDLLAVTRAPRPVTSETVWRKAVHEAGQATAAYVLAPGSIVHVSIRERGRVGGWTAMLRDPEALTRARLEERLQILFAGRAAEELLLGAASAGAGGDKDSDLAWATELATDAVTVWGLGRTDDALRWWPVLKGSEGVHLPEPLEREINEMLGGAYAAVTALLRQHEAALRVLASRWAGMENPSSRPPRSACSLVETRR